MFVRGICHDVSLGGNSFIEEYLANNVGSLESLGSEGQGLLKDNLIL
ncbi:hypothetical protein CP082626L3_0445 [Chlamydia psittaci 08-2626_L3]|nr:hypothetical protein CP082626L3_0445 [Chlamydia psittaci 08-2626_L3]